MYADMKRNDRAKTATIHLWPTHIQDRIWRLVQYAKRPPNAKVATIHLRHILLHCGKSLVYLASQALLRIRKTTNETHQHLGLMAGLSSLS